MQPTPAPVMQLIKEQDQHSGDEEISNKAVVLSPVASKAIKHLVQKTSVYLLIVC